METLFRRKKRLDIAYIEELKRFAYVVEFKGNSIDNDANALCYLRACKEILLFYIGTGRWSRLATRDKEKEKRMPFIVYENETTPATMTFLLKHMEEIHRVAEDIYSSWQSQRRTEGRNPLECHWSYRP